MVINIIIIIDIDVVIVIVINIYITNIIMNIMQRNVFINKIYMLVLFTSYNYKIYI